MGIYANQLKGYSKSLSLERMIKALGIDKTREILTEVSEKTRGYRTPFNTQQLDTGELVHARRVITCTNIKELTTLMGTKNAATAYVSAFKLLYRYLNNEQNSNSNGARLEERTVESNSVGSIQKKRNNK